MMDLISVVHSDLTIIHCNFVLDSGDLAEEEVATRDKEELDQLMEKLNKLRQNLQVTGSAICRVKPELFRVYFLFLAHCIKSLHLIHTVNTVRRG